jgi:hypothetical protein
VFKFTSPYVWGILPSDQEIGKETSDVMEGAGKRKVDKKEIKNNDMECSNRHYLYIMKGNEPYPEFSVFSKGGVNKSPGI